MRCSECGYEERAMKTVYWPCEGDEADEHALCERCYGEVAEEVLIVPGPVPCFGTCKECSAWFSLRDLHDAKPGGRRSAPSGICPSCAAP
jgi:ribosomal protein L37E